ncbi:hypothetical protein K438DRAFT_2018132 [Mycena galopus ATCC 62051]|nr:hypothetical protein K438DRAFT_2018132 [Mycena galopus ATCC 62051]
MLSRLRCGWTVRHGRCWKQGRRTVEPPSARADPSAHKYQQRRCYCACPRRADPLHIGASFTFIAYVYDLAFENPPSASHPRQSMFQASGWRLLMDPHRSSSTTAQLRNPYRPAAVSVSGPQGGGELTD